MTTKYKIVAYRRSGACGLWRFESVSHQTTMRSSGIAPLLQKRLSGAIALALLIVAFAPQRTRWTHHFSSFWLICNHIFLTPLVKLQVLNLLDRSDASCFFPQGPQKSATPVDKKEKVPKDTLKGVAEHVKIFNERGILRLPPSETFNDLETDCDPLFHPYGSLFLAHDPLMFAHVSQPVERICGSQTCTNKMRAVARILRPKFPMKMQVAYVCYSSF